MRKILLSTPSLHQETPQSTLCSTATGSAASGAIRHEGALRVLGQPTHKDVAVLDQLALPPVLALLHAMVAAAKLYQEVHCSPNSSNKKQLCELIQTLPTNAQSCLPKISNRCELILLQVGMASRLTTIHDQARIILYVLCICSGSINGIVS